MQLYSEVVTGKWKTYCCCCYQIFDNSLRLCQFAAEAKLHIDICDHIANPSAVSDF